MSAAKQASIRPAPPNEIGLTKVGMWSDMVGSSTIEDVLQKVGVDYDTVDIPLMPIKCWSAYLLFYVSPRTGLHVTVFCVPVQYDVDGFACDYFYFEGLAREQALASEQWWLDAYPACRQLRDVAWLAPS